MLCECGSKHYLVVISFKYNLREVAAHASPHRRARVSRMSTFFLFLFFFFKPVTDFLSIPCSEQGTLAAFFFFFNPQSYVEVLTCEKGLKAKYGCVCKCASQICLH